MDEQNSTLVRHLNSSIVAACEKENVRENLDLCIYLMNLKLLQSSEKMSVLADNNLCQKLIKQCVNDLKENPIWINTLKLQVFWREKYRSKGEIKNIHHETILKSVLPITCDIVEGSLKKAVDKENLYRKIVIFIIMFTGLGSPTQQSIIRETQAALYSIFKNSEIENFLTLSKSMKEQQLIEFARLVTGIRLFNKDCKRGGEGIVDLPLILTQGVKASQDRVINYKNQVDKRIENLVKVLMQVYDEKKTDTEEIDVALSSGKLEELKSLLIYARQIEFCLKNIIKDLDDSLLTIDALVEKLQTILLQIHDVVRYRVAIATVQVFPLFLELSNVWVEMQEQVDILSEINNNLMDLSSVSKSVNSIPVDVSLNIPPDSPLLSDVDDIIYNPSEFHPGVKVCSFSAISDEEYLQYEGFCSWTLARTSGVLITGNISIGVLSFENRFYSFVSPEAAHKWAKDPKLYVKMVVDIVRTKPDLIKLLNVSNDLELNEEESLIQEEPKKETESVEVQTDLHPVESYISKDYTFSEWELKRRAIKLASLTKCTTKSQQTISKTRFQPEVGVQMTPVSNKETQTRRDGSCNHPGYPSFAWKLKTRASAAD